FTLLLFFQSSADPRALHSFPTRRSSDLTRPLAGTRRRGADPEEDIRLEKELLSDLKERAEHVMLVDLARNHVGRVARPGSVAVEDRKSTLLNSSHLVISYAVFCLKKKNK